MKKYMFGQRFFIPFLVVAALLVSSESFAAKKSKVSIMAKAKSENSKDDGEEEIENENSITMTSFQSETEIVTLTLQIKNGEAHPVKGQLEWYFISDHSSGKTPHPDYSPVEAVPAVFSSDKKEVTIAPGTVLEEIIISEPFMYEEKTVDREWWNGNGGSSSRDYETGDVYEGYLVLLTVNGKIIAKKANSSRYQKEEWIKKCRNN